MSCFSVHKTRWAVVACAVVWIISLVAVIPMTFLITSTTRSNRSACLDLSSSEDLITIKWYNLILTTTTFCLPLVIVTLCYTMIIYTLTQGPQTHSCLKQKARRLTILLLLVFYICFLPFHILRVVRIESRLLSISCSTENQIYEAYIVSKPLAALNTFGNLLLYVVVNDNFQRAICSTVRCKASGDQGQAKKISYSNNPWRTSLLNIRGKSTNTFPRNSEKSRISPSMDSQQILCIQVIMCQSQGGTARSSLQPIHQDLPLGRYKIGLPAISKGFKYKTGTIEKLRAMSENTCARCLSKLVPR